MTQPLGRLERIDVRKVWLGEASDFTPWLALPDNITLLGEAIAIDLEVEGQEQAVGPFRADILCKDTTNGHFVLIENQLERTDHIHLGQLLTYAAGLEAVTVVWVAPRFTDEHRAALDWLNQKTTEDLNFFGLEIEVWRIGDSPMAPKFNVVSQPNDWAKTIKQQAVAASGAGFTEVQQLHFDFWQQFSEYCKQNNASFTVGKPTKDHWKSFGLGRTNFALVLANQIYDHYSSVAVGFSGAQAKANYFAVKNQYAEAIREVFGEVEWRDNEQYKESQIRVTRPLSPSNREDWPSLNAWMLSTSERWLAYFRPVVKGLVVPVAASESSYPAVDAASGPSGETRL